MSSSKYAQDAIKSAREYLQEHFGGRTLPKKVTRPWRRDYVAETDATPVLNTTLTSHRSESCTGSSSSDVDIITEVSTLASHLALPREGHLDTVFWIYGYLGCHDNRRGQHPLLAEGEVVDGVLRFADGEKIGQKR